MKSNFYFAIIVVFLFLGMNAKSQNNIIGTYWDNPEIYTLLDITANEFIDINELADVEYLAMGESTYDPVNKRYFIITNLGITIIDAQDGIINNVINNNIGFKWIEYDKNTNIIFGAYWNQDDLIFASLDLFSGSITDISVVSGVTGVLGGVSTYDDVNNRYFINTNLGITVINSLNGAIVNLIPPNGVLGGMEYNRNTNKLLCPYWNENTEVFATVDIDSGEYTDLSILEGVNFISQGVSTFDPIENIYITSTDLGITIIDASNGSIVNIIDNTIGMKGLESNFEYPVNTEYVSINEQIIDIYPNPFKSIIQVDILYEYPAEYQIYSIIGKLQKRGFVNNKQIDLLDLNNGIYFLKIGEASFKIVKAE